MIDTVQSPPARLRHVIIDEALCWNVIQNGHGVFARYDSDGPPDARVVAVHHDPYYRRLVIRLEHPSFDPVPPSGPIPAVNVTVTSTRMPTELDPNTMAAVYRDALETILEVQADHPGDYHAEVRQIAEAALGYRG